MFSRDSIKMSLNDDDLYYTSSSSSSSSDSDSDYDINDTNTKGPRRPELIIWIVIDDKNNTTKGSMQRFKLHCGTGRNSFKWLAMVAAQRYSHLSQNNGRSRVRERYHSTPGQFSPSLINHKESDSLKTSSVLEGLRRRSMHRHGSAILRAVKTNSLKINPKSSLREILCSGDTVTVVISARGDAFCERDGRFVARSQPSVTPFEGAAFHTSPAGQARHESFKQQIQKMQHQQRHKRMTHAASVLFGKQTTEELKDRNLASEAAKREHLLHTMFQEDWMKMDLHGILKRKDRPQVMEILKEHFSLLLKVFDHFSTIGIDFVFQAVTHSLIENLGAERATIWIADYKNKEIWTKVASGTGGGKIRIPMGTGIVGDCIATGKSINIPDAYRDSRFNPDIDKKTGFVTRQILCVPAKSNKNGKVLGALQIINRKPIQRNQQASGSDGSGDDGDGGEGEGDNNRKNDITRRRQSTMRRSQLKKTMVGGNSNNSTASSAEIGASSIKLRPFSKVEQIDVEHVADRFGRELKQTKDLAEKQEESRDLHDNSRNSNLSNSSASSESSPRGNGDHTDGGRTGGMSLIEFHKMCETIGFFELKGDFLRNGDVALDSIFDQLIARRTIKQQSSNGMRRKSRISGQQMEHPNAMDRQSFLLMLIWVANKAYSKEYPNNPAKCLIELIKRHICPHSKLFSPTDIKTIMLEEENAQVLLEHYKILKLLFIRYKNRGTLEVINRKNYLEMCKAVDVYRLGLKHDDVVRMFKGKEREERRRKSSNITDS